MVNTMLLLLLPLILFAEAQYNSPSNQGISRRISLRKPVLQPILLPVVTSAPVPITIEKKEYDIVKEPLPSVISPPMSYVKPTELNVVFPQNYTPAILSSTPALPSGIPIRLPPRRPSPPIESTYVPTTILPTPSFIPKFTVPPRFPPEIHIEPLVTSKPIEIATAIPNEPPSAELAIPLSKQKLPEIMVTELNQPFSFDIIQPAEKEIIYEKPVSEKPIPKEPVPEETIFEELISLKPISEELISEEPIYEKLISKDPIFEEPISSSIPTTSQAPAATLASIPHGPSIVQPVYIEPSKAPVQVKPIQPFADIENSTIEFSKPLLPSSPNHLVSEDSKPPRKPWSLWHAEPHKPIPTLVVPKATEVYTNPPKAPQKPQKPVSSPKKLPPVDPFAIDRLHDYDCRNMDKYESIPNTCDSYVECKRNIAFQNICPDGLHFNPAVKWPEYPCGYPSEVKCRSQDVIQEAKPSAQCPHRYGFYPLIGSDCGKYLMCQEGLATVMPCPPGLAFSAATSSCDWPSNVPDCNPLIFKEYSCPPPTLDEYGEQTFVNSKFRYRNSCKQYIACQEGKPRLLSCDHGMSFDDQVEACVSADQVIDCAH